MLGIRARSNYDNRATDYCANMGMKFYSTETSHKFSIRGHPKMSTFSQVYKPYARGRG